MEITGWLDWFAEAALSAQQHTLEKLEFVIAKTRLLDGLRGQLNARQEKALLRMLAEGPERFRGRIERGQLQHDHGRAACHDDTRSGRHG